MRLRDIPVLRMHEGCMQRKNNFVNELSGKNEHTWVSEVEKEDEKGKLKAKQKGVAMCVRENLVTLETGLALGENQPSAGSSPEQRQMTRNPL